MSHLGETATYNINIVLSTDEGEYLPSKEQVSRLVYDQMSGVLDEETGLRCLAVGYPAIVDDSMDDFDSVAKGALNVFPEMELGEDNEGQFVVYTGIYNPNRE